MFVYTGYYVAHLWYHNLVVLAFASAWAESASYYAFIVTREFLQHKKLGEPNYLHTFFTIKLFHLLTEFGPAEVLDSLIVRPLLIGLNIYLLGPMWGLIAGKLMSDFFFYIPVIISYEMRRYWHKKK